MTDEEFQNRVASLPNPPFFELFEELQELSAARPEPPYRDAVSELRKVATRDQRAMLREMLGNRLALLRPSLRLTPEERITRALHRALEHIVDGAEFLGTLELRRICVGLEHFVPSILAEVYPFWTKESLDGFYFSEARKVGPQQASFFGMCILISDQSLTPIHVHLKVVPSGDKIDWMECRLGQRGVGEGEMVRVPWQQWRNNSFVGLPTSKDLVDWVYKVTFGVGANRYRALK